MWIVYIESEDGGQCTGVGNRVGVALVGINEGTDVGDRVGGFEGKEVGVTVG